MNWLDPVWLIDFGIWVDHIFSAKRPNRNKLALVVVLAGFFGVALLVLTLLLLGFTSVLNDKTLLGLIIGLFVLAALIMVIGLITLRGRNREFLNAKFNSRKKRSRQDNDLFE